MGRNATVQRGIEEAPRDEQSAMGDVIVQHYPERDPGFTRERARLTSSQAS
jgi:hypothetical protein